MRVSEFDPSAGGIGYLYAKVADHIVERINAGELPPGTRLPAEGDLADEYGIALGTIRRATQELRDRGRVISLPGKGTFVTDE